MFSLLAMGILGGMSTLSGAVAGALVVTALSEVTRRIEGAPWLESVGLPPLFGLTQIVLAVAILFVMYRRPDGLIAWREPTWRRPAPPTPLAPSEMIVENRIASKTLRIAAVSKSFDGVQALNAVSLEIRASEALGLIGPNGSGKTTLVNIVSGVLGADIGTVALGDVALTTLPPHRVAAAGVARTFQNIRVFEHLSVYDNIRVAALVRDGDPDLATRRVLAEPDLDDVALTPAGSLAYGVRRRVEIARALAMNPVVLLLDEPTARMNEVETADLARRLKDLQRRQGLSLLVIEHDQSFVRSMCDRLVVLSQGSVIAEGAPEAIRRDPAVIEAYLGRRHTKHDDNRGVDK